MFFGISFIGWTVVAIVYAPVVLWLMWLGKRWVKGRPVALAIVGVLTFLPLLAAVAEAVYVDRRFKALCKEARTEVKRSVVVEGYFDARPNAGSPTYDMNRDQQYRFLEWRDREGRYWRAEKTHAERGRVFQIDKPTARYHYLSAGIPQKAGYGLERLDKAVIDTQTGETLASEVLGYRRPALVDLIWLRYFDPFPSICGEGRSILTEALVGIDLQQRK